MQNLITIVGMDAHKDTIAVALLSPGQSKPLEWKIVNEPGAVRWLARSAAATKPARAATSCSASWRRRASPAAWWRPR